MTDFTAATPTRFYFDNVVTQFGCLKILIRDQGSHFINHTISALMEEFHIQHKKNTPYHPHANGTIKAFNKVLDHALTKFCNESGNYWDLKIPTILWAYQTTCKWLTRKIPFKLVYGQEVLIPMEYIFLSLCIIVTRGMDAEGALEECLMQLL